MQRSTDSSSTWKPRQRQDKMSNSCSRLSQIKSLGKNDSKKVDQSATNRRRSQLKEEHGSLLDMRNEVQRRAVGLRAQCWMRSFTRR